MSGTSAASAATRSFEAALLRGEAKGFAVCAKSLRFARLPDTVAMTFAEIDGENRYYVFASEAQANRRLADIPAGDRLGWEFCVREVRHLHPGGPNDGPKLDLQGFPFSMRGFLVSAAGEVVEWTHPSRLGWRGAGEPAPVRDALGEPAWRGFGRRMLQRLRRLLGN